MIRIGRERFRRPTMILASVTLLTALTTSSGCQTTPITDSVQTGPAAKPSQATITLPNQKDSLHFAVIGDSGSGAVAQYRLADQMTAIRELFPYDIVLMLGDNLYTGSTQADYEIGFEKPYKRLLDAGVKFYASLGNHDNTNQRLYKPFNMNDQRFYTFKPKNNVRFFSLDSNYMSPEQLTWLDKELAASQSDWKICYFHHPLYASGMHGSDMPLREKLEPLFVKHNVDVVLSGHEHFYERIKPQKGIQYFVSGGAGKLRKGDIRPTNITAKGYDQGFHFMLMEIVGDKLHFRAITQTGQTIDSGVIQRRPSSPSKDAATIK